MASKNIPKSIKEYIENNLDTISEYLENMSINNNNSGKNIGKLENIEVKSIIDHRCTEEGIEYLISWKGYSNEHNSWVNERDCNCFEKIVEYFHTKSEKMAFLFCRVSTKDQASSVSVSLKAQESELRKYAYEKGYDRKNIMVFKISESAYINIPKKLQQIGFFAKKGDIIMVHRVDRLSRNITKYLEWLEGLNDRGVKILSLSEKMSYSKHKLDFIQNIVNAQKESMLIGKRIKSAFKVKRERGDAFGAPFGKKLVREKSGKMVRVNNTEELEQLKTIRNLVRNYKGSKKTLTRHVLKNVKNLKKRGKYWSAPMINAIIKKYNMTIDQTPDDE
jgi:DNA invertase Pin-like site-specific DNA recombinase